jgi:hypothetical protein
MPYNLPKHLDTPANNRKMESCVNTLMASKDFKPRGKDDKKTAAIKVCKTSIMGKKKK